MSNNLLLILSMHGALLGVGAVIQTIVPRGDYHPLLAVKGIALAIFVLCWPIVVTKCVFVGPDSEPFVRVSSYLYALLSGGVVLYVVINFVRVLFP